MKKITRLDLDTTRALLAAAVAEKGADYVYPTVSLDPLDGERPNSGVCFYLTYETTPTNAKALNASYKNESGCIAGNVLMRAGVTADWLHEHEALPISNLLDRLHEGGLVSHDLAVQSGLREAQQAQDKGATWGEAVERFEEAVQNFCRMTDTLYEPPQPTMETHPHLFDDNGRRVQPE